MRISWRLPVAVLALSSAAGILAAVALGAPTITITSVQVRAGSTQITSGPMGSGYDIQIQATVTDTQWQSTRWTTGGVARCVNHSDQSAGTRTVTLAYQYENALLREGVLPDPDKVGPSEHVFVPPPAGTNTLTVELFNNNNCTGTPLASSHVALTTATIGPNKELLAACEGMKVAVVLDESGSIGSSGATQQVRDATKALAQGLVGTGARMSVFKFSTTADTDFIAPYQTVTQSWINGGLTTYLNRYSPGGSTNWQSGLAQARNETLSDPPDLVVFLTDGNPNKVGNGSASYEEGYYTPMAGAATVADQIKQTSHMFVIGVGVGVTDALSALRIEAVSGTKSFPTYPISTADYTLVTDFGELEDALGEIASNLCNVTVTVEKETDDQARDSWVDKPGWDFSGRTTIQPPASQFGYKWFEPNVVDPVNTTTATQSGATGTDGRLRFVWRPTAADSLSNITVSESVPAAYTPYSVTCVSEGSTIFTSQDPATVVSFTLQGLKVRAKVDCTVRNHLQRSTVRVVKNWVGAPASATIFVDATGAAPFDASSAAPVSGASASFDYPVSTGVTVGEVLVPAGYSATIDCGLGTQPYTGGPFPVTSPASDGATRTCTITNTQQLSTVRVIKHWVGAPASATIFVDRTGAAPFDASKVATVDGDNASFDYPLSTPVTVGEVAIPPGYAATIACGQGTPQPYTGGPFPVNAPDIGGATLTCTITNTQQLSTVRVVKQWEGTPASATIFVDQDGVAPFDASTVATADGDNTSFDYTLSTPVTVGEVAVPAGYSAAIDCGQGPQSYTGGPFPVIAPATDGATLTCTITNTQLFSTVRVVKQWEGTPASATIFVDQDGAAPFDASTVATADGDNASFDYPVSTPVTVGEVAVPAGYRATIQCDGTQEAPQPYAGGPFSVAAPSTGSATLTCTITNIQLLSTVQVVKEWAGGTSSATIFVDAGGLAPYDASRVATASGDDTSFSYPVSTPVTLGETAVPAGFRAQIDCGAGPQAYGGGPFPVTSPAAEGATLTCTVINTPQTTVRVIKQWGGTPNSATIFVDRTGQAPYDVSSLARVDGDSVSFDYPPSTQVTLGEVEVPAGYLSLITCDPGGVLSINRYTGGPFTVTSPAAPGGVLTCTVVNARRPPPARLVVTKTAKPKVVRKGHRMRFFIKVTNKGPGTARNVRVCDKLPPGLELVRAPGAKQVNGQLCWTIGRLKPGQSRRFVVVAKAVGDQGRIAVNVVEVSGLNVSNCPRLATKISKRQHRACSARARVKIRARKKHVLHARIQFTG